MKKNFLLLVITLFFQTSVFATDISFIYINGSNNNNQKMTQWFLKGVHKLHPHLKKTFETNKDAQKLFLDNGVYKIEQEPKIFFWGDKSKEDLDYVKKQLDYVKEHLSLMRGISPLLAYKIRVFITECLHDAIWVQKIHNMVPILADLDNLVKKEVEKGNEVLLLGYSAGSFITFEYLLTKLPYINLKEMAEFLAASKERLDFIDKNPKKNTCFYAFAASGLGNFTAENDIFLTENDEHFKKNYLNIDYYTDKYCSPGDKIKGVINFASPLVLFYSELGDRHYKLNAYLIFLYKYLVEHDIFLLTVNYCDDPLGFPTSKNLTNKEIAEYTGMNFNPQLGFIYDYSDMISLKTALGAHTSYWSTSKRFSKMIVNGFVEGYKYQYNDNIQKQILKKQR